ncbi:MAG: pentapeptide repeat-containing protein [Actinomycetota bacterium]
MFCTRLVGTRLVGTRLVGTRLVGTRLVGTRLVGTRLVGTRLVGTRLVGADAGPLGSGAPAGGMSLFTSTSVAPMLVSKPHGSVDVPTLGHGTGNT